MKKLAIIAASVAGVGVITTAGFGVASAASTMTNPNVGTSGIPRTVFTQERQAAASQVLNTSTANIQAAHKNKTFSQLLTNAGLTKQTYAEKLKAQLTTDLEAKGYTQDKITIALQYRKITHLHHKQKSQKETKTTAS